MNVSFCFWLWCDGKETSFPIINNHKRGQHVWAHSFQTLDNKQPKTEEPEKRETHDNGLSFPSGEISPTLHRALESQHSKVQLHSRGCHPSSGKLKQLGTGGGTCVGEWADIYFGAPHSPGDGWLTPEQEELHEVYTGQLLQEVESEDGDGCNTSVIPREQPDSSLPSLNRITFILIRINSTQQSWKPSPAKISMANSIWKFSHPTSAELKQHSWGFYISTQMKHKAKPMQMQGGITVIDMHLEITRQRRKQNWNSHLGK